jgi:hypothetical protein
MSMIGAGERLITYQRVSTARQGASGLGLEAQRQSIEAFAVSRGARIIARYTEVESGKTANRPELTAAIQLARLTCHGIFPPVTTRVRPKEGMDDEANDTNRRTDYWYPARA